MITSFLSCQTVSFGQGSGKTMQGCAAAGHRDFDRARGKRSLAVIKTKPRFCLICAAWQSEGLRAQKPCGKEALGLT
jgi:hypothetical protein